MAGQNAGPPELGSRGVNKSRSVPYIFIYYPSRIYIVTGTTDIGGGAGLYSCI